MQAVTAHLEEDINVRTICEYFEIGKTYLYEIGRQHYGVGIAEHIRNLRIKKAKSLLVKQTELQISEIASFCGFQDYNYFITTFKRVVGVPPKKYREQNQPQIISDARQQPDG